MAGWSALLGGLGGVAIVFGLMMALLAAFQPVPPAAVWGNLLLGLVLLASAIGMGFDTLRERLVSGEGRRAGKYGSSAVLSTILGIAILSMLGFLSTRYSQRWDWTEQSVHTLTDQSLKVLSGLEREVQATAFFSELDAPRVRDLLERYRHASDRFQLDFVDPNSRPDLVQTYGLKEESLARGLVRLAMGDDAVEVTEFEEAKITNALVQLSRSSEKKIYVLAGHNERPISGVDADGKEGFGQAAQALRNENYQVESLIVAQAGGVPDDANAVVIAGPTRILPPEELAAIARYVKQGGALLLLLDPRANTNADQLMEGWGIDVGDDIIVDMQLAFFQQYMSPFAGAYAAEHPITKPMGEQRDPTLFHVARSIEIDEGGSGEFQPIVYTGKKSWAERNLDLLVASGRFDFDGDDRIGPVPVAAAGVLKSQEDGAEASVEGRVVVIGDSDFATNEFMVRYGGNRDLLVNSINWLLGDVEAISVRPHQSRASRFVGSEQEVRAIQYLSVFVLPEAIAVMGVFAWWLRRKAPGR
jgi:ABC-type uncharacterized transport system involved in gliding motility auxiliary subunit